MSRVNVTLGGRSESTNLQGGTTDGAFSPEDTHIRTQNLCDDRQPPQRTGCSGTAPAGVP